MGGHGWGWLSKLGISYPVSVSFAGCNPTACADGKSGEGNRTVLSGLWVSAPPRRGWDGESRAGLGCKGGEAPTHPLRGAGGLAGGFAWGSTAGAFGARCAGAGVWQNLSWTKGIDSGGDAHRVGLGTGCWAGQCRACRVSAEPWVSGWFAPAELCSAQFFRLSWPRSLLRAGTMSDRGTRSGVAGAAGPASCSHALPSCLLQGGESCSGLLVWVMVCLGPKWLEVRGATVNPGSCGAQPFSAVSLPGAALA